MLDAKDEASTAIFEFIEEALESTESVLVHSVRGQSRATCCLAAYIMRKYKWSLLKTLEFLNSRRPDLEIRATFIHQLSAFEARLQTQLRLPITQKWDEISNPRVTVECEELVLRNTFVNAQMGPLADFRAGPSSESQQQRGIRWSDDNEDDKARLVTNKSEHDLIYKEEVGQIEVHRDKSRVVKRIIKPFRQTLAEVTGVENIEEGTRMA